MSKKLLLGLVSLLFTANVYALDEVMISQDEAKALVGKADVRFVFADGEKDFENGHIPGSVVAFAHDLAYLDDIKKCKGLPMCEETANSFIGKDLGIDDKTKVVVYDNGIGVNATGTWFYLALYGVKNAKILEGGLATWQAKGNPVDKEHAKVAAKTYKAKVQWDMIADIKEVEKATKDQKAYLLVDSRHTLEEYTGKQLGSSLASPGKEVTVPRGGFIPTAIFSPWTKYANNKSGEPNRTVFREADDLKKQLDKLKKNGYAENKTVISYCQVGLGRGSYQYLAFKKAGHKNVKVYVGSWAEWGASDLPVGKSE